MSMGVLAMRGKVHWMHDFLKDLLVQLVYNNIVWCGVTLCCKFTVPVNISYTLKFKVLSLWKMYQVLVRRRQTHLFPC